MNETAIVATVEAVRTRGSTQEALLTLAVPIEHAALLARFLGMVGQQVAVAFADVISNKAVVVNEDVLPSKTHSEANPVESDHGAKSGYWVSALYKSGFFFNPKVLVALGTDEEFLSWLKTQPCAVSHLGDCEGDVVAAHVRRIANGSGTGIKPKYSAIPLCHKHHMLQHSAGESAIAPKSGD